MAQPSSHSVLELLTKARLATVGRELGVALPGSGTKEAQVEALASSSVLGLPGLLHSLGRDELRAACRAHGLDDSGRSRPALLARLLAASGEDASPPGPRTAGRRARRGRTLGSATAG